MGAWLCRAAALAAVAARAASCDLPASLPLLAPPSNPPPAVHRACLWRPEGRHLPGHRRHPAAWGEELPRVRNSGGAARQGGGPGRLCGRRRRRVRLLWLRAVVADARGGARGAGAGCSGAWRSRVGHAAVEGGARGGRGWGTRRSRVGHAAVKGGARAPHAPATHACAHRCRCPHAPAARRAARPPPHHCSATCCTACPTTRLTICPPPAPPPHPNWRSPWRRWRCWLTWMWLLSWASCPAATRRCQVGTTNTLASTCSRWR